MPHRPAQAVRLCVALVLLLPTCRIVGLTCTAVVPLVSFCVLYRNCHTGRCGHRPLRQAGNAFQKSNPQQFGTYRLKCYKVVVAVMTVRCAAFIIGNLFPFARRNGALLFQQFTCSPKKTPLFCLCFLGASPPKIIGYINALRSCAAKGAIAAPRRKRRPEDCVPFLLPKGNRRNKPGPMRASDPAGLKRLRLSIIRFIE